MPVGFTATDAADIVARSLWKAKPEFSVAVENSRYRQWEVAEAMEFSPGSLRDTDASSQLSRVLRKGQRTNGMRILRAALLLDTDPYALAEPVAYFDPIGLQMAVNICLQEPMASIVRNHVAIMTWAASVEAGGQWSFAQWNKVMGPLFAARPLPVTEPTLGESANDNEENSRRLIIAKILEVYVAYTRKESECASGDKFVVDLTGAHTKFKSWSRPEFDAILGADKLYARSGRRVIRAFAIDPKTLPLEAVGDLEWAIRRQLGVGVQVRIKFVDPMVDRDQISDIGVIGDYALDVGVLETLDDRVRGTVASRLFVPANDTGKFKNIRSRADWVRDEREAFATLTDAGGLKEVMQDVGSRIRASQGAA